MDELRTDLEELLGDGDLVMSTVDVIADRITRLGYLKVVRCEDCKHWDPILPEVYEKLGIKEDIKLGLCWNEDERNQYLQCATEEKFYCAYGEPKEVTR